MLRLVRTRYRVFIKEIVMNAKTTCPTAEVRRTTAGQTALL